MAMADNEDALTIRGRGLFKLHDLFPDLIRPSEGPHGVSYISYDTRLAIPLNGEPSIEFECKQFVPSGNSTNAFYMIPVTLFLQIDTVKEFPSDTLIAHLAMLLDTRQ